MTQPLLAVIGATGAQGGGLVDAALADPQHRFRVRAITRKPDAPRARALADAGAEVVAADLDDVDSLAAAFAGAHGVFAVTNFWEHFSPETELRQAGNLAEAAKRAGARHVVWSTLEDTRKRVPLDDARMPTLQQRYKVPHFDAKGEANELFRRAGVPTTFLNTSFYWDNLIHFGMAPQRGPDGVLGFLLPMGAAKLPGIAAADIGACAFGVFARGEEMVGREIGIAGEHLSGAEMAAALSAHLGEPVRHVDLPFAQYAALGFPGADDLANMFQYKHDFEDAFRAARPVEASRALHPGLQSFAQFLERHRGEIVAAPATG
jgi:uncharacterized protein YbjT (DUF2867 family)